MPPAPAQTPAPALAPYGVLWLAYFGLIGIYNPYAPLWLQSLGLSTLAIGAMASLQAWTRLIAPYGWSWLADHRGGRVRLLRAAAVGTTVGVAGLAALSLWPTGAQGLSPGLLSALVLLVALVFLANGGIVPLAEAALAQLLTTPTGVDAARYGRVRMWGSLGFILTVAVSGPLLQGLGIGAFAWLLLALCAGLLVAVWRLPAGHEPMVDSQSAPPVAPVLRQPAVRWFLASVFFTVLAHASVYAFLSLYVVDQGYGKSVVAGLWSVSVALEIAAFWTQGRWFGRLSPHGWLQVAAAAAVLRFAMTAAGGGLLPVLVLAQALHMLTFAAHHAACIALVARYFPGRLRGRGQALYSALGYGLSGLLGGVAGGWLIERAGLASVFWAAALCGLAGWACARRSQRLGPPPVAAVAPPG